MLDVYASHAPKVVDCETGTPGYSFYFDLIARLWQGCRAEGAIHRLCSLMRKMGAKTLVEEELEPNEEIEHEFQDIRIRLGAEFPEPPKAHRLSFFAARCKDEDWQNIPESSFLGYAVTLSYRLPAGNKLLQELNLPEDLAYVLEAVTRPPTHLQADPGGQYSPRGVTNYYVHCHHTFQTTIGMSGASKDFDVTRTFFCQQNNLTHVCAHAALRMILNTAQLVDHKVTNRALNGILGIDHEHKVVGKGLTPDDITGVANHYKLNVIQGYFLDWPTVDYAEFIYPFVESGYPVFLAFNPTHAVGHTVAVVGHTMNSDKWDCEAHLAYRPETRISGQYHASAAWVDHFILNDDNFGMYSCMPLGYLRNKTLPQHDMTQRARFALAFVPRGIDSMPYLAEKTSVALLRVFRNAYHPPGLSRWLGRLWDQLDFSNNRGIVARTLMCEKKHYEASLRGTKDSEGQGPVHRIHDVLSSVPDRFWLTEISLPDLYTANKHKLGDILSDTRRALVNGQEVVKYLWGWLPGVHIPPDPKPGVTPKPWPLTGHIPLQRSPSVLGPHVEW